MTYDLRLLYINFFKPLIDFVVALIIFTVLSPVFVVVVILLAIANTGKPFFLQRRPGKDGKLFKVIKFKTMNDRKDKNGALLPDDERLTVVGRFVRNTSLDELPQMLNVLKGDMSLIGPRPLLEEYLPLYNEQQMKRHGVRPGITGWAQVNGRNAISWDQKFEYDVWYVNNISFALDFKIFFFSLYATLYDLRGSSGNVCYYGEVQGELIEHNNSNYRVNGKRYLDEPGKI